MRIMVVLLGLMLFVVLGGATSASVRREPASSRVDLLAQRLARDPIQVTDHLLRETPPDAAARIKALVARLGVPVYVVVAPLIAAGDGGHRPAELIPLLRDRLGKDGVYLVAGTSGSGAARQYGGSLPAEDAWRTAYLEMPYDAGIVQLVQRFVEILTVPDPAQRIKERRPRPEEDEDDTPSRGEVRDRKEMAALFGGTALSGIPLLVAVLVVRPRRKARR